MDSLCGCKTVWTQSAGLAGSTLCSKEHVVLKKVRPECTYQATYVSCTSFFLFYQVSNIHEIFEALQEFESDIMSGDFPPTDIKYYVHVSFCFTRYLTSMRYLKRSRSAPGV